MLEIEDDYQHEISGEERFWTLRRIVLTVVILITLAAFLAYTLLSFWISVSRPVERPTPTLEFQRG